MTMTPSQTPPNLKGCITATNFISPFGGYTTKDTSLTSGYYVYLWYKETSKPNNCYYVAQSVNNNNSTPRFSFYGAPPDLGGSGFNLDGIFSNGVQYSIWLSTRPINGYTTPLTPGAISQPVKFGIGQGTIVNSTTAVNANYDQYCGPNNPYIFIADSSSPNLYINVKGLDASHWDTCTPNYTTIY
jgi:hypothetical protein